MIFFCFGFTKKVATELLIFAVIDTIVQKRPLTPQAVGSRMCRQCWTWKGMDFTTKGKK